MGDIEVRRLAPDDDLAAVARVYVRSWRRAYKGIVPQSFLDSLSEGFWQLGLERGAACTFAAFEEGKVVGVCVYSPARTEAFAGWGEIVSLYVVPESSGRGAGTVLLNAALGALAAEGFERVYLWVLADNAHARAFYEWNGFQLLKRENVVEIAGRPLREACYAKALG